MYHEEHALPGFVHARSREQLRLPSVITKGETPVIYFYTGRSQAVTVEVGFPTGIWTQWYPQASLVGPRPDATPLPEPRGGHIRWQATIIPARESALASSLPPVGEDALWRYSREVDAAYVKTLNHLGKKSQGEYERFLFYRGLGTAPLPLRWEESRGGTLSVRPGETGARHLFVLRVEKGRGVYRYLPGIEPGEEIPGLIPSMQGARPLAEVTRSIAEDLTKRLTESGLYPREARAMVNTWKNSYFGTEGTRVLFVLPQAWTDRFIPMKINPKPTELVRVMVGRLELLTPERGRQAERAVRDLASPDGRTRAQAFQLLRQQGRFVEPILRRVVRTSQDEGVKTLCRKLLLTDFVTELRAAVHTASDGSLRRDSEVNLRAQLASLLREIGLKTEAKAEGERALAVLRRQPEPSMSKSGSRHWFRAVARAVEGTGDLPATVEAYGKFIQFASNTRACGGCHQQEGPRTMAWFKDWWAGRKYAEAVRLSGQLAETIEREERAAREGGSKLAREMRLAYLYEAGGDHDRAAALWARIAPEGARQADGR